MKTAMNSQTLSDENGHATFFGANAGDVSYAVSFNSRLDGSVGIVAGVMDLETNQVLTSNAVHWGSDGSLCVSER